MTRHRIALLLTLGSIFVLTFALVGQQIGETPGVPHHMDQNDIENGQVSFDQIVEHGRTLFTAFFNRIDGQGRPAATMNRVAGPESHSCVSCHNRPRAGGGGDFPTNVFLRPEGTETDAQSDDGIHSDFSNERRTMGLYGSGPIEMLAREMTYELRAIRL